jgi:hypothetical protein
MKTKHIPRVPLDDLTCKGKVPYHSIIEAINARDILEKKVPGKTFNIYICKHCGEYHLGGAQ